MFGLALLLAATVAPTRASLTGGPAAAAVVRRYYALLGTRRYADAYRLWNGAGQASGKSYAAFRRGFARTASTTATVGRPGDSDGAAGSIYIDVPVTVTARLVDGTRQRFAGAYTLRRINDVDGSTAAQTPLAPPVGKAPRHPPARLTAAAPAAKARVMDDPARSAARTGVAQGVGAYLIWGLLPLFLRLLTGVPALEILAHRVVWSLLLLVGIVVALRRLPGIRTALATPRTRALLLASAALIAVNWLVYIWAVLNGHVLEASLGYFINPLVNVALGVAVLGERLRRLQGVAVAVAALGVIAAAAAGGGSLWISIALALSFGTYGLVRKVVAIDALGGLLVETALLAPFCLALLLWRGSAGVFGHDGGRDLLLIAAGAITAAPLLLFAAAARRLRYATMGLLQYLAPTLQFGCAILVFGEPLRPALLIAFVAIWAGCALYAVDGIRSARRPRAA